MELSLEQLFRDAVSVGKGVKPPKLSKSELIIASEKAIQTMESTDKEITGKAISDLLGVPRSTLIEHPEIATLRKYAENRRIQRIEEARVVRASTILREARDRIETYSQENFASALGISRAKLRCSEALLNLLRHQFQL